MILKDTPNVLHVGVSAPVPYRIQTVMARYDLPEDEAKRFMNDQERTRVAYFQRYFKAHPDDPTLYHLCVNPSLTGIGPAEDCVVQAYVLVTQGVTSGNSSQVPV